MTTLGFFLQFQGIKIYFMPEVGTTIYPPSHVQSPHPLDSVFEAQRLNCLRLNVKNPPDPSLNSLEL